LIDIDYDKFPPPAEDTELYEDFLYEREIEDKINGIKPPPCIDGFALAVDRQPDGLTHVWGKI
jgi:hypothetical protein